MVEMLVFPLLGEGSGAVDEGRRCLLMDVGVEEDVMMVSERR